MKTSIRWGQLGAEVTVEGAEGESSSAIIAEFKMVAESLRGFPGYKLGAATSLEVKPDAKKTADERKDISKKIARRKAIQAAVAKKGK
jgi:hypothetical protein